jgi:hypothetical protein
MIADIRSAPQKPSIAPRAAPPLFLPMAPMAPMTRVLA